MNRRDAIKSSALALAMNAQAFSSTNEGNLSMSQEKSAYYEVRSFELRNDIQPNRLSDFIQQHYLPALKRNGIERVGAFRGQTGMTTPGLLLVSEFASLGQMQSVQEQLLTDKAYQQALQAFELSSELPYVRIETSILRAFAGHTKFEIPAPLVGKDGKPSTRLFELRTYESRSTASLRRKIDMFNQEEIKIFRDCGFAPVFFGECIAGPRMPALTYLVGFDNMEQRDQAWAKFVASPEFNRIKVKPGWTDPEAVSNIRSAFVRPLPFSAIK